MLIEKACEHQPWGLLVSFINQAAVSGQPQLMGRDGQYLASEGLTAREGAQPPFHPPGAAEHARRGNPHGGRGPWGLPVPIFGCCRSAGRQAGSSHQQALQVLKGRLTVLWISSQILILAKRCVSH